MISRRKLLATAAPALLVGCTTAQQQQVQTDIANAIAVIQAYAAQFCGILPTVGSILGVVASVTGNPLIATISTVGIQAVEQAICAAVPPKASARYRALPLANTGAPAVIGKTPGGVTVSGWRTQ